MLSGCYLVANAISAWRSIAEKQDAQPGLFVRVDTTHPSDLRLLREFERVVNFNA